MCAAAANGGANEAVNFPANYSPVMCVHSANELGKPSQFTPTPRSLSYNFTVLGENVKSAWPGKEQDQARSGTSIATPILAAVMSLILEFIYQKPVKTQQDLRIKTPRGMTHLLQATSKQEQGYHLVQPWSILEPSKGRARVESRILDIMDQGFPVA